MLKRHASMEGLKGTLLSATLAVILLANGAELAAAQFLNLSGAQERLIDRSISNEKRQVARSSFQPSVGDKVPSSLTLRKLPASLIDRIPSLRKYRYIKLGSGDILVVDPHNRKIVYII